MIFSSQAVSNKYPRPVLRGRVLKCVTIALFLSAPQTWSETGFELLEDAMTAEERRDSGIDSLTSEQRAFLNAWLGGRYGDIKTNSSAQTDETPTERVAKPSISTGNSALPEEAAIEAEVSRRVAQKLATTRAKSKNSTNTGPFEASILGDFTGWRGKTVFRLDNGQIWRQRSASQYRHRSDDRRVKFEKNWMGGWEMTVVSSGKTVLVSKVR